MVEKAVLEGFRSLDSWQKRVLGTEDLIEETRVELVGETRLTRGALILTYSYDGGWYLSYIHRGIYLYMMRGPLFSWGADLPPSRTRVESAIYLNIINGHHPYLLPKLDRYQKVCRYLSRHPEHAMAWVVSGVSLFRAAALEVLDVR